MDNVNDQYHSCELELIHGKVKENTVTPDAGLQMDNCKQNIKAIKLVTIVRF